MEIGEHGGDKWQEGNEKEKQDSANLWGCLDVIMLEISICLQIHFLLFCDLLCVPKEAEIPGLY